MSKVVVWHWFNVCTGEKLWSDVCPGKGWEHWKTLESSGVHCFDDDQISEWDKAAIKLLQQAREESRALAGMLKQAFKERDDAIAARDKWQAAALELDRKLQLIGVVKSTTEALLGGKP